MTTSAYSGFHKLSLDERLEYIQEACDVSVSQIEVLKSSESSLPLETADTMVENCISRLVTPIGVAMNFLVDGKDVFIPMATEEPSVVAAASFSAKLCRPSGGFRTAAGINICTGQASFLLEPDQTFELSEELKNQILSVSDATMPSMVSRGGKTISVDYRIHDALSEKFLVIEIHIHVVDAMGANCVTKAAEAVKNFIQETQGFEPIMGIVTNFSSKRIVSATAKWKFSDLNSGSIQGEEVAKKIVTANNLAKIDKSRASTHRKGIMNGITAVVLATGNDTRAVETAVHTYAMRPNGNMALTEYRIEGNYIVGEIRIPIPVGTVGGSISRSKSVQTMFSFLKVEDVNSLAKTIAAVGLAQNFAALRALVTKGISEGHMRLHSRNIACEAGAVDSEIDQIAKKLIEMKSINVTTAKQIITTIRRQCKIT